MHGRGEERMTFQQELDDNKPCLSPPIGYPSPGLSSPPMSLLHSGYTSPYDGYHHHPNIHHPDKENSISLARIMLCLIVVLILGIALTSFLVWAAFGNHSPRFEVQAFSLPNFDIDNTSLNASFATNIVVSNPSDKLALTFSNIESRLMYKGLLVDTTMVDAMNVGRKSNGTIITKFEVPSSDFKLNKEFCLKSMNKDHRTGRILLSVRFSMVSKMSSGDIWKRRTTMVVFCDDLMFEFEKGGGGKWNSNKRDCSITV